MALRALAPAPSWCAEAARFHPAPQDLLHGSGETSSTCLKTLLTSHCLQRLLCFVTDSTRAVTPAPPGLSVWGVGWGCLWQGAHRHLGSLGPSVTMERWPEIHSVDSVRVPASQSAGPGPHRRGKQPAPSPVASEAAHHHVVPTVTFLGSKCCVFLDCSWNHSQPAWA